MKKYIVLAFLLLMLMQHAGAQEYLLPLQSNPALKPRGDQRIHPALKVDGALELPFADDFSNASVYPDSSKWQDAWVYVNRTFGPLPPTVGMATFDALDDTGAVYSWATSTPFEADILTSKPIRLDSVTTGIPMKLDPADSVYLSFFYQPQGNGNNPDTGDFLVLEFYNPTAGEWTKIWEMDGATYQEFFALYNTTFRLVMIPVIDTAWFKDGFQFRFKNYASIVNSSFPSWQSNMDQWNIDYVYLDYNRSYADTTFDDVAFVNGAESMLNNYMQMPARQFTNAELKSQFNLKISNLASTLNNISYQYDINEVGGTYTYTKLGGDYDILPFNTNGYHNWPFHATPVIDFSLPAMTGDSTVFETTHTLGINGWTDMMAGNNTIKYRQEFYNYYAYDDGTAELGYGLAGVGSRLAYKFTLNQTDTLGGVKMFFNQTLIPPSSRYFYIVVWSSFNPENIIYKSKRTRPYTGDSLNAFHTYYISDTTLLLSGTFYVGWQQITDEVINIGFDRNVNSQDKIFYNTEGVWQNTAFEGSLMMRPFLGTAGQQKQLEIPVTEIRVFPNPIGKGANHNMLNIGLPDKYLILDPEKTITVEVFNNLGAKVLESGYTPALNVSGLQNGFYVMRLNSYETSESFRIPFIIAR